MADVFPMRKAFLAARLASFCWKVGDSRKDASFEIDTVNFIKPPFERLQRISDMSLFEKAN